MRGQQQQLRKQQRQQQQQQQNIWTWATNLISRPTKRRMSSRTQGNEARSTRSKYGDGSGAAPLAHYAQKAWRDRDVRIDDALGGSDLKGKKGWATSGTTEGDASHHRPDVPMLRPGVKNRILYYIGSFNPPHLGHLALADFVYAHSGPDTDYRAVAVVFVAHGAYWIERKAAKEARRRRDDAQARERDEQRATAKRDRKQAKDLAAAAKRRGAAAAGGEQPVNEEPNPLVLPFAKRVELLRRGVEDLERGEGADSLPMASSSSSMATTGTTTTPTTTASASAAASAAVSTTTAALAPGKRNWLWIFPSDLDKWWMFEGRLEDACESDGFDLEFIELLGPDYVQAARPQLSGMNGIATSNVCRPADFVPEPAAGSPSGEAGFVHVDADAMDIVDAGASMMARGADVGEGGDDEYRDDDDDEADDDEADADYDMVEPVAMSQPVLPSSSLSLPSLKKMSGFGRWRHVEMSGFGRWRHVEMPESMEAGSLKGLVPADSAATAEEGAAAGTDSTTALTAHSPRGRVPVPPTPAGRVWVCNHESSKDYTLRFVECKQPSMDPDMSSTKLREILAQGGSSEDLLDRIRGIALSPELLVRFVEEEKRAGNV
jgi:hypothetical protein